MEFIDKSSYQEREKEICVAYLQACFNAETKTFYPAIDTDQSYNNFSSKTLRKGKYGWESLLMREQNGRCCYCMRRLDRSVRNIEHVIPRNFETNNPQEEFSKYTQSSDILRNYVMLSSEFSKLRFDSLEEILEVKQMPHRIALQNMLVSCNGKFGFSRSGCCCNNARSNDFLLPLMLMPCVVDRVHYDGISGVMFVYPPDSSWNKIVELLNDDTYKEIRVLWYRIWKHKEQVNLEACKSFKCEERIKFMKLIFDKENLYDVPEAYQKYAGQEENEAVYWKMLLDFDWFFTYKWE